MTDFVRVYSKDTKSSFNWPAAASTEGLDVIEGAPTHDVHGATIPIEHGLDRKPTAKQVAESAVNTTEVQK